MLFTATNCLAGGFFDVIKTEPTPITEPATENITKTQSNSQIKEEEKKDFSIQRGDAKLTLSGKSRTESFFHKNAVLLNSHVPDEAGYFKQTLDTNLGLVYGEKTFGHKALEFDTSVRFKTIWGKIGDTGTTEDGNVYVDNVYVGKHNHLSSKSLLWIREAWLKFSFNSTLNLKTEKLHFFKLGMFPFSLGRGIALGDAYGFAKNFLAIYSRATDYYAPGMLLSGELSKDKLSYDLYYAKLEEKSASFSDTFNSNKEKIIGRRSTPWAGVAKDSDLIAGRLQIKPLDSESAGVLNLEPYTYFNYASDQKVDKEADSKSKLGAVGLNAEYAKGNFEIGGEIAFNYGHEQLFNIDKNETEMDMVQYHGETEESLREVYSKVLYNGGNNDGKKAPATSTVKTAITDNTNNANSGVFTSSSSYKSASDRFRPAYKNNYRGWMGVIDAAYNFPKYDLKIAAAYGYASGDKNPHAEEKNKNYKGFVSLHEFYTGNRVSSIFMFDARKVKRPLALQEGSTTAKAESDTSFADLHFTGFGFTWEPKQCKNHNLSINPNVLLFWKAHESPKFITDPTGETDGAASTEEKANKFLGTEFNVKAKYNLLKDLSLIGNIAVFVPGAYYRDIKGVPMSDDLFSTLEESDKANLSSERYRISNDAAYFVNVAIEYKF